MHLEEMHRRLADGEVTETPATSCIGHRNYKCTGSAVTMSYYSNSGMSPSLVCIIVLRTLHISGSTRHLSLPECRPMSLKRIN